VTRTRRAFLEVAAGVAYAAPSSRVSSLLLHLEHLADTERGEMTEEETGRWSRALNRVLGVAEVCACGRTSVPGRPVCPEHAR
jgi:hypothetical protein